MIRHILCIPGSFLQKINNNRIRLTFGILGLGVKFSLYVFIFPRGREPVNVDKNQVIKI